MNNTEIITNTLNEYLANEDLEAVLLTEQQTIDLGDVKIESPTACFVKSRDTWHVQSTDIYIKVASSYQTNDNFMKLSIDFIHGLF